MKALLANGSSSIHCIIRVQSVFHPWLFPVFVYFVYFVVCLVSARERLHRNFTHSLLKALDVDVHRTWRHLHPKIKP
jgi:hypothetical protein